MGILDFFKTNIGDKSIVIDSKWNPGTKLKFMAYNKAIRVLKSGDAAKMTEAIGENILNAPKLYNNISVSLKAAPEDSLIGLLLPLLKHEDWHVRCCIPSVLQEIGDLNIVPILKEVIQNDQDKDVVRNARHAVEKLMSIGVKTDSVKLVRRYTKSISSTLGGNASLGTYEEYSAPNKIVARAFLDNNAVTKDYFYIEVITPEGNIGKDKNGLY